MSGRSNIDYPAAEKRFVTGTESVREVAVAFGLKSWSSMATIAKRDDWRGKRAAYQASIARRSYEVSAAGIADQRKEVIDEAILAGRATLRRYIGALAANEVKVTAQDAKIWAAFLMDAMTERIDNSSEVPDVRNVTPPDHELLRRVVEAAREHVDAAGSVGPGPLVIAPSPRTN